VLDAMDYFTKWKKAVPLKNMMHREVTHFIAEHIYDRMPPGKGFVNQDQLERFSVKREHNQLTKVQCRIINSRRSYYNLGSRFKLTKG
jgi:CO dehydrogenase/acetyl-CoA synthase beta subunit